MESTVTEDRLAEARARLDQPRAETFRFEKAGAEIAGTVVRLDLAETEYGQQKIVVLDPGDGNLRSIWLLHDALLSQMKKLRPRPGDVIAVRYLGRQKSGSGRSYHAYTVASDGDRPGFEWDGGQVSQDAGNEHPFDEPIADEPPF